MDALGSIKPVVSQPVTVRSAPVLPNSSAATPQPSIPLGGGEVDQVGFDAATADQQRFEALKRAASSVPQPLGSQVFTMYRNGDGTIITRFRDTNTGKVTYIPEQEVFKLSSGNAGKSLVDLKV